MIFKKRLWTINGNYIWFIYSFCFTSLFFLFANMGLLFNIPNILGVSPALIKNLSSPIQNPLLTIYIAYLTLFTLFFSFAQFSFTTNSAPLGVIREYLLKSKMTYSYLGYNSASILALTVFVIIEPNLTVWNYFQSILSLSILVFYSIAYFYWLIGVLEPEKFVLLIFDNIKIQGIQNFSNVLLAESDKFNNSYEKIKDELIIFFFPHQVFLKDNRIDISFSKRGILFNIDIYAIYQTLHTFLPNIKEISLNYKIGDNIPYYNVEVGENFSTIVMTILAKNDIKSKDFISLKQNCQNYLPDFFTVVPQNVYYKLALDNWNELIKYSLHKLQNEPYLRSKTSNVIRKTINHKFHPINKKFQIQTNSFTEKFFKDLLRIIESNIEERKLNESQTRLLLTFIHSLKQVAFTNNNISIVIKVLDATEYLYRKVIFHSEYNYALLASAILSIKDIALFNITYMETKPDYDSFNSFHNVIIRKAVDVCTEILYHIVTTYKNRTSNESDQIIKQNISSYMKVMEFEKIWGINYLDETSSNNNYYENIKELSNFFLRETIYIAITIYKRSLKRELPLSFIHELALPMIQETIKDGMCFINSEDRVEDIFWDPDFNFPISGAFSIEFEIEKLRSTGSYSPEYYSFNEFWIIFSLFRNLKGKAFLPSKLTGIPHKDERVDILHKMMSGIKIDFISSILCINETQSKTLINNYIKHLFQLINWKKLPNMQ